MVHIFADGGNCAALPDHTMEAVLAAVSGGCAGLYVRVHGSREGEPFLRRESDLSLSTNGRGDMVETPARDLRQLDAAERFRAEVDAPWRRDPRKYQLLGMPALEEILWWLPFNYPLVVEPAAASLAANPGGDFLERLVRLLAEPPAPLTPFLVAPDLETGRLIRKIRPGVRICLALDNETRVFPGWAVVESSGLAGLVLPFGLAFEPDGAGELKPAALLEQCIQGRDFQVFIKCPQTVPGPALALARELESACALVGPDPEALLNQFRSPRYLLRETFAGTRPDLARWKFGYARQDNEETRIYQNDGLHIVIDEGTHYSGAAAVSVFPVRGDFSATVEFTATNPALAGTMELGAINVSAAWHHDRASKMKRHDEAFDTHAAAPFVCVENDEADGFRVMNNRAGYHFTNRYHRNVGTPGCQKGALRLDRRGSHFSGYYQDARHQDWVGCGSMVNESLNQTVFLRLAAKHWGKIQPPLPANHVVFSHFELRLY